VGQFWTPIWLIGGSLLHAYSQSMSERRFKEDVEHEGFVFQDNRVQLMWQGKYDMEVGYG